MHPVVGTLFIALLIYLIHRWSKSSELHRYFWPGLILKLLAGWFLGLLYFYYYNAGDTISFFEDGLVLQSFAFSEPGKYLEYLFGNELPGNILDVLHYDITSPRAWFFDKFLSVSMIILGRNYWVLSAFFSLMAFWGTHFFAIQMRRRFHISSLSLLAGVYLLPSVVLWSSGVTKESLAVTGLMLMIGIAISGTPRGALDIFKRSLWFIGGFWICWELKYYYAGLAIPAIAAPLLAGRSGKFRAIAWIAVWAVCISFAGLVQVNLAPDFLPEVIYQNNQAFTAKSDPGDYIIFPDLQPDWISIARNIPLALWSGLFRPFITDMNGVIKWGSGLESLFLLVMLSFQWSNLKKVWKGDQKLWFFSALIYIMVLAAFLALSTPNFGTLVRYKAGFYFLFSCLILWDHPIFVWLKKRIDG